MTRQPEVPVHHGEQVLLPDYVPGFQAKLETPLGEYVVEMRRSGGMYDRNPYYWRILSQPRGAGAMTTGSRPSYQAALDMDHWSYNEYHRAINFLEDRLYAEQHSS